MKDIYINRYMYTFNHFKVNSNIRLFVAILKHIYAHEHNGATVNEYNYFIL